jgi:hypothetical protein
MVIFKIQAPTFKDTIENDEIMHVFINYLNSLNSISILQIYLMISMLLVSKNLIKIKTSNNYNLKN